MSRRTCPACTRRYAGLIDPDCAVCSGLGVLGLGPAALHKDEPATVARAIEIYLEARSRDAAGKLPLGESRRDVLAAATDELRVAGVIADTLALGTPARDRPDAPEGPARRISDSEGSRLAWLHGANPSASDQANLDAAPTVYGIDDRPLAQGLPVVSSAGSPAFLAKAADPADPLGDTRQATYGRLRTERRADVVAAAVTRLIEQRARQARRTAVPVPAT
jgi:hypothetical protein